MEEEVRDLVISVQVDDTGLGHLLAAPPQDVTIDVESAILTLADGTGIPFPLEPFARYCLLNGIDELGFLLKQDSAIARFEAAHSQIQA